MDLIKKAATELVAELVMSIGSEQSGDWVTRVDRKMRSLRDQRVDAAEKRLHGIYRWLCPKATVDYVLKDHE